MSTSTRRFTDKLRGSSVLIIGGTSGVGLGTAAALLEAGANVILSSSRQSKLSEAIDKLKSSYPSLPPTAIAGFTCDLGSPDVESNLQTLLDQVSTHLQETQQQLNHLIYTAGDRLPTIPLSEVTLTAFNAAIQVRGASALLTVKTFANLLPPSNKSSITLTSGSICDKPIPGGWSILAFVGAGLTGMTRQLAQDLAPIRVNCVAPGVVDTDLWSHMDEGEREEFYRSVEQSLPTGRVPDADDIAESYLYLLRGRNVTGSIVHTNGGAFL